MLVMTSLPALSVPRPSLSSPSRESRVGVSGVPGLRLGVRRTNSRQQMTVPGWTKGDIKLKKGLSQLVMFVVGE